MDSGREIYYEADEQPAKSKSKKNTKRWCRGKAGKEHRPVIGLTSNWYGSRCRFIRRSWGRQAGQTVYSCCHGLVCEACGKLLEFSLPKEIKCPDVEQAWEEWSKNNVRY